jgi:hypothetical protein
MLTSPTHRRASILAGSATAALLAGLSAVATPPATAAHDVTAPIIKTNAAPGFVVGSVIGESVADSGWDEYTWSVAEQLKWTVKDDSGEICAFDLYSAAEEDYWPGGEEEFRYYRLLLSAPSVQPTPYVGQYVDTQSDYNGDLGGDGDTHEAWIMTAEDCAGNAARVDIWADSQLTVTQENNGYANSDSPSPGRFTYTGTWATTTCACASWGAMRKTTAKGASFTFTRTYQRDDHVGLVMAKGPGRGSADVYVDGLKVATINTYASANKNRVIVYDKWMSAGTHTVRVVNLATAGHSRIDLDAVLTN